MVEEINSKLFEEKILNSKYSILDFYSTECPPCEKIAPIFNHLSELFGEKINFYKIFRNENKDLAAKLGVSGSPSILFFKDGEIVGNKLTGYISQKHMLDEIQKLIPQEIYEKIIIDYNTKINSIESKKSDVIVIGGGPAGVNAAIYLARYKVETLLISPEIGGQVAKSHKICNYLSYDDISGFDLTQNMIGHLNSLKVPVEYDFVNKLEKNYLTNTFLIQTESGKKFEAKKVIFTAGTKHRHLNVPGEEELMGKGVSYCATCDAAFFKDKEVSVIGGGDSALKAALLLSEYATKVYLIYRKDNFYRAEPAWVDQVNDNKKINVIFNEEIRSINGETAVESVSLKSGGEIKTQGVFVEIGSEPKLDMIDLLGVETDMMTGHIIANSLGQTNVDGFLVAGDVVAFELKQIITAASQGASAAYKIYTDLSSKA